MFYFYCIPIKTHFRQVSHLIFRSRRFLSTTDLHKVKTSLLSENIISLFTLTSFISDLSLSYLKGCSSNNKQLSFDYFLHWEGPHWVVFTALINIYQHLWKHTSSSSLSSLSLTGCPSVSLMGFINIRTISLLLSMSLSTALTCCNNL